MPMFDIDLETLRLSLQEASLAGIGVSFMTGLVFSFNPVSFASIPVVLAYVTKAHTQRRALLLGSMFVMGMLITHAVLGVAAALGGEWAKRSIGHGWELLLGPLLVTLGLLWPGWIKIRLPWIGFRGKKISGAWGAFLLGIPFSVAACPFCTPALVVALTASAAIGSAPFGLSLLLAFALGRSIPILLGAWSMGWLESLKGLQRSQKTFEIIAGATLIVTGLYLVRDYVLNHH
jgi:cytochrome c-type biogenesis protein